MRTLELTFRGRVEPFRSGPSVMLAVKHLQANTLVPSTYGKSGFELMKDFLADVKLVVRVFTAGTGDAFYPCVGESSKPYKSLLTNNWTDENTNELAKYLSAVGGKPECVVIDLVGEEAAKHIPATSVRTGDFKEALDVIAEVESPGAARRKKPVKPTAAVAIAEAKTGHDIEKARANGDKQSLSQAVEHLLLIEGTWA